MSTKKSQRACDCALNPEAVQANLALSQKLQLLLKIDIDYQSIEAQALRGREAKAPPT
jgi:hypothetical protein